MTKRGVKPLGATIVSVMFVISAGLSLLNAFLGGVTMIGALAIMGPMGATAGIVLITYLLVGFVEFFIAKGLRELENWSQIIALIFAGVGALAALAHVFLGDSLSILYFLWNVVILFYLGLHKKTKKAYAPRSYGALEKEWS